MGPIDSDDRSRPARPDEGPHLDADSIALLAIGEAPATRVEGQHLSTCGECRTEVDRLSEAADLARATVGDGPLVAPPAHVWAGIERELGFTEGDAAGAPLTSADRTHESTRSRFRPPSAALLIAAAAAGALVIASGVIANQLTDSAPQISVVAQADLEALPDWPSSSGAASVTESETGERLLLITLDAPSIEGAIREVWLLTPEVDGLVSVGLLQGGSGQFVIPEGVDLGEFPVVDVSLEPLDGDPAHSGDSIVRGRLDL
jgi:anti-sigma-K factor RskA